MHKIIEGHNLNVTCHAQQTPDVQVFWVKNDTTTKFRQNGTELLINYIYRTATGSYLCYSLNLTEVSADPKLLETIMVEVLCKYRVSMYTYSMLERRILNLHFHIVRRYFIMIMSLITNFN